MENTIGRKMFILAKGMVEIIKWDSFRVGVLVEGQYFGEMAILGDGAEEAKRVRAREKRGGRKEKRERIRD